MILVIQFSRQILKINIYNSFNPILIFVDVLKDVLGLFFS